MRPALVALVMLALCSTAVRGGPNAHGAIVVHTNDAYSYLSTTICTTPFGQPATCESAITRTDKGTATVVWFLAAFLSTASPRVAIVYFGIDFDDVNLDPTTKFGLCGPTGTVEVLEVGWPSNTTGTTIGFGTPIIGDTLFRFYYFKVDEFSGLPGPFLCSATNPTGGYAAFFDDNFPPLQDNITRFGCVRWYELGYNDCPLPVDPTGACCLSTGACVVLTATDCADQGVYYVGDGTDCAPPNPWCAQPGACCDPEMGTCAFFLETACLAPHVFLGGPCAPTNPCPERGACCFCEGDCAFMIQADCLAHDGFFHPEIGCGHAACAPPPPGACCLGQECLITNGWCCRLQGGEFEGAFTVCDPNPCEATPAKDTTWGRIKATFR